jgi:hypothetical protein
MVGGDPARAMLGLLLARGGIHVAKKHADSFGISAARRCRADADGVLPRDKDAGSRLPPG